MLMSITNRPHYLSPTDEAAARRLALSLAQSGYHVRLTGSATKVADYGDVDLLICPSNATAELPHHLDTAVRRATDLCRGTVTHALLSAAISYNGGVVQARYHLDVSGRRFDVCYMPRAPPLHDSYALRSF